MCKQLEYNTIIVIWHKVRETGAKTAREKLDGNT